MCYNYNFVLQSYNYICHLLKPLRGDCGGPGEYGAWERIHTVFGLENITCCAHSTVARILFVKNTYMLMPILLYTNYNQSIEALGT